MSEANTQHEVMKSLSTALQMSPLLVESSAPEENEEQLPVLAEELEMSKIDKEAEEDFEVTRENTKQLLVSGQEALDGILRIASSSEHPRAYEVAANLLKTMADMNAGLLKLHEQRRQLVPDPEPEKKETATNITNNNVFVGSTQEFLDMLEAREQKGTIIEHDESTS